VIRDRYGCRAALFVPLRDDVASSWANFRETMVSKNITDLLSGENAQFTQPLPRSA